jgi:hypothetical protein
MAGEVALRRVPDAVQRPISAFTRVFDTLWRCAAEPGPTLFVPDHGPPMLRTAPQERRAAQHPGKVDRAIYLSPNSLLYDA